MKPNWKPPLLALLLFSPSIFADAYVLGDVCQSSSCSAVFFFGIVLTLGFMALVIPLLVYWSASLEQQRRKDAKSVSAVMLIKPLGAKPEEAKQAA